MSRHPVGLSITRRVVPAFVVLAFLALAAGPALAAPGGGARSAPSSSQSGPTVDLDVLFIGAHPDDEAFALSAYGQWNEQSDVQTGVITITRGEGGGNAVGPEEGPALGLIREAEERRAVGYAGIEHIYNLDEVDFFYTVSGPLTEEVWGQEETLEKVVRVVRATRPEVIVTMNPAPTPGNHGHHQIAARLAVEAFTAAADPTVFPEQLSDEGLRTWRAGRIFRAGASGSGPTGSVCATAYAPAEPTDLVYGVWSGTPSSRYGGTSWAQVARIGQREYASQGWAVFPDQPEDPTQLGCTYFTQIDSRVPYSPGNSAPTAALEGALEPAAGGLPLGTEFFLTTDAFDVAAGASFTVTAHARYGGADGVETATAALALPNGWSAEGDGALGALTPGEEAIAEFTVTPAAGAAPGRAKLLATLTAGSSQGTTTEVVRIVPTVSATLQPLSQVAQFREWAASIGASRLDNLIFPVASLGVGETREIRIDLNNAGETPQSGSVTLDLPEGFTADAESMPYTDLAPGGTGSVSFQVTNSDTSLATANEGGQLGNYPMAILATTDSGGQTRQDAALNLVPVTSIPQAAVAPTVDGVASDGEYGGDTLDLSRVWEGQTPDSAADASGSAQVVWTDDALYVVVNVVDDTLGTVLTAEDAKRHWRTDSVEIAFDPRGTSENTSTTFKVGIFPTTDGGEAAAYRDADANQGPIAETAPDMEVASTLTEPYTGYTIETKIPLADLPAGVDPANLAMNIFIYDSDTQDKTGQSRLGWSVWNGVQGDPYRWGIAALEGYTPAVEASPTAAEATMPLDVALSIDSPQSILQSATDGVALAGNPAASAGNGVSLASVPTVAADGVTVDLLAPSGGRAHVFVWSDGAVLGDADADLMAGEAATVSVPFDADAAAAIESGDAVLLVGFAGPDGGTSSLALDL